MSVQREDAAAGQEQRVDLSTGLTGCSITTIDSPGAEPL